MSSKSAKRAVARAKAEAYQDLYESLHAPGGEQKAFRIAKAKHRNYGDALQAKLIK